MAMNNNLDTSTSKILIEVEYVEKHIEENQNNNTVKVKKNIFGNPYLFLVSFIASFGGILFGYDQGVIAGVQEIESFKERFSMTPIENGFVVSILELGAWAGTYIFGFLADKISRKYSIGFATLVFLIGSAIQGAAQVVSHLLIGRFIGGLGVGGVSAVIPTYLSELAPPEIRGSIMAINFFFVNFGVAISFWIDFGASYIESEAAWRLPLYLQLVFGAIILCGIFFLPFSPRWLMTKEREKEALLVLSRLRHTTVHDPAMISEWKDIKAAVLFDKQLDQNYLNNNSSNKSDNNNNRDPEGCLGSMKKVWISYTYLFRHGMWRCLLIGVILFFFQQFTGINAIIYYAPHIINSLGLKGIQSKLLATGVIGVLAVVMGILSVLWIDKIKRRSALMIGAAGMGASIITIGILSHLFQTSWDQHRIEGWVAISMLYVYLFFFGMSWGPVAWVLGGELFPLRIRAKGVGITASSHWLNNFIIGLITPPLLATNAAATYFMFGGFCFVAIFFVKFFVPETRGRSLDCLDDMEALKGIREQVNEMELPIDKCMASTEVKIK